MTHTVNDFLELRYPLRNPAGAATEALVSAERPEASRTEPPWEAIPDPAWLRFVPERLDIGPGATAAGTISIVLPDDPRLFGRHFEAVVRARTRTKGLVAAGLRSRLRFSVGPAPRARATAGESAPPCSLEPGDLWLRRVAVGSKAYLTVHNPGSKALILTPVAVAWTAEDGKSLPRGYRPPGDLAWVEFNPRKLRVSAGGSARLELALDAPAELRGRRVVFEARAEAAGGRGTCRGRRVFVEFE